MRKKSHHEAHQLNNALLKQPALKSSTFKPMPSVGCFGKYFSDNKYDYEHKGIDCTNEHGRSKR